MKQNEIEYFNYRFTDLSISKQRFIENYVRCNDSYISAVAAGISKKIACRVAHLHLLNPLISKIIQCKKQQVSND